MCKPNDRITTVLNDLMELKRMIEELQAEETALTDEIKAYMGDEETMLCGTYKVTYKEIASKRGIPTPCASCWVKRRWSPIPRSSLHGVSPSTEKAECCNGSTRQSPLGTMVIVS